jgi:TctA family transporter
VTGSSATWGLIVSMWVGNLFLVLLNVPLIGIWVKVLAVPHRVLFPTIIAFACIGTFSLGLNLYQRLRDLPVPPLRTAYWNG